METYYPTKVYRVIKDIFNATLPTNCNNDLIHILEKMTESDYINLNLPEAKELLEDLKQHANDESDC